MVRLKVIPLPPPAALQPVVALLLRMTATIYEQQFLVHAQNMGLVEYSESEGSDAEPATKASSLAKPKSTATKPAFQKVVDRSNPHKIRVALPEAPKAEVPEDGSDGSERAAKRVKTEGRTFSGFNSMLPAPKRTAQTSTNGGSTGGGQRRGLGSGVSLKTGPEPGFRREAPSESTDGRTNWNKEPTGNDAPQKDVGEMNGASRELEDVASTKTIDEPVKKGTAMMFKPLSVARKPPKKKLPPIAAPTPPTADVKAAEQLTKTKPSMSLFSLKTEDGDVRPSPSLDSEYKPLLYEPATPEAGLALSDSAVEPWVEETTDPSRETAFGAPGAAGTGPQSLGDIASDLNLSESARRQLFGRSRGPTGANASAIKIVNFNTDEEYAANEALRAAGEQVQHNPVRAIAPGKHSLKQLVNAASTQKDALEEHFASGKRNKKEAGSKYGW